MLNFFDILPNSMQVKDTQHLQHLGAFLQNSFLIQQTSNLRKVVLSTLKEDYFLMQLKSTELLLTISSLFKKKTQLLRILKSVLWRNILICYFHYIGSMSVAVHREAFVTGPYSELAQGAFTSLPQPQNRRCSFLSKSLSPSAKLRS